MTIPELINVYNLPPRIFLLVEKPFEDGLAIGWSSIGSIIDLDTLRTIMNGVAIPCYAVRCTPGWLLEVV